MMNEYMKEREFCKKWLPLLEKIDSDEALKNRCKAYSAYLGSDELTKELHFSEFLKEAYESGIVTTNYQEVIKENEMIYHPTDEFINNLSKTQIIACIA